MAKTKKGFKAFYSKFPITKNLPLVLSEEKLRFFSKKNKPISNETVEQFCLDDGETYADEYTEYIACTRLPETGDIYSFILWRGGLLEYAYLLVTFDKKGNLIEKNIIGGTKVEKSSFKTVIATIKNSWNIEVKETMYKDSNPAPTQIGQSAILQLTISPEGKMDIPKEFKEYWS